MGELAFVVTKRSLAYALIGTFGNMLEFDIFIYGNVLLSTFISDPPAIMKHVYEIVCQRPHIYF